MEDTAKKLYGSLKTYKDLQNLIDEDEIEGLYLECKAPRSNNISPGILSQLAEALSGFSNTSGGVIIWGIETVDRQDGIDTLIQLCRIANCLSFMKKLEAKIPTQTMPSVLKYEIKVVKKKQADTSGTVVLYVPQTTGDPVRSLNDYHFYFRAGDQFIKAPYEVIKKLFTATISPDIHVKINEKNIVLNKEHLFEIPISIFNSSSAIGEYIVVYLEVLNEADCQKLEVIHFKDVSDMNPGRKLYNVDIHGVLHKQINLRIGTLRVSLKERKKKLCLAVEILAKNMVARTQRINLILSKKGSHVNSLEEKILF